MVEHIQYLDLAGDPAPDIAVSLSAGETSDTISVEIWNDKNSEFLDTTTSVGQRLKLLASTSGGPYVDRGVPILDERWASARITHYLSAAGETTVGSTGNSPIGTNSELPVDDLAPQTGIRVELQVITPGGEAADAVRIKLRLVGNMASSPLSQFVGLATGSAIVPADRSSLASVLRGRIITADDSDTVAISRGLEVRGGVELMAMAAEIVFDLEDSAAVELGVGESYKVTVSDDATGAAVATKSLEGATAYPDAPAGNIFIGTLIVTSPDGIVVTVSQADIDQSARGYAEFYARAGAGLTLLVSRGDAVSSTDLREYVSHEVPVGLTAASTNRVWLLPDGTLLKTTTAAEPEFGALLLWIATTDGGAVTGLEDARVFAHRSLATFAETLTYSGVLSTAGTVDVADWTTLAQDAEIESVAMDLADVDASWTAGAIVGDILTLPPGAPISDTPASIYTSSGTDDARPTIAFDATVLRSVSVDHEVRRILAGSRVLFSMISTIAAPAPEPEQRIMVTLTLRRYR